MSFAPFFTILNKLKKAGYTLTKEELISNWTSGRTESIRSLSDFEHDQLIKHMNKKLVELGVSNKPSESYQKANKMRRKIISQFHIMKYEDATKAAENWAKKKGYLKKDLNSYTLAELPELVWQAEKACESFLSNIHK